MSKGRIVFGGQGEGYTKRKKIMKGTDPNTKPEIKQWNPAIPSSFSDLNRSGYASMNWFPIMDLSNSDYTNLFDYRLFPLTWPLIGTSSFNRIGNSIFLKALRFKGYITVKGNLPAEFRWRIRLWRFRGDSPVYGTGNWQYQVEQYLSLFRAFDSPKTVDSMDILHGRAVHNFHKMFKKLPKEYDYECKVIMSGVIPPSNVRTETATTIVGEQTEFAGSYAQTLSSDRRYNLPIDIKVKCNDRITWSRVDQESTDLTSNVVYFLSLEDDYGCGVNYTGPSVSSPTVSWNWSGTLSTWPVCFNFFVRGYFTDD